MRAASLTGFVHFAGLVLLLDQPLQSARASARTGPVRLLIVVLARTGIVTACTGRAVVSSCRNCRRITFLSTVSARAAPCASSISVTTDKPRLHRLPGRRFRSEPVVHCCPGALPRSARWSRVLVPCRGVQRLAMPGHRLFDIAGEVLIDRCR